MIEPCKNIVLRLSTIYKLKLGGKFKELLYIKKVQKSYMHKTKYYKMAMKRHLIILILLIEFSNLLSQDSFGKDSIYYEKIITSESLKKIDTSNVHQLGHFDSVINLFQVNGADYDNDFGFYKFIDSNYLYNLIYYKSYMYVNKIHDTSVVINIYNSLTPLLQIRLKPRKTLNIMTVKFTNDTIIIFQVANMDGKFMFWEESLPNSNIFIDRYCFKIYNHKANLQQHDEFHYLGKFDKTEFSLIKRTR